MKSHRKRLARAFTKMAKQRWDDSSKTHNGLRRHGFKNSRQWGRYMASYFFNVDGTLNDSVLLDVIEDAAKVDMPLDQNDYDYVAEEEVSCW